MFSVDSVVVWEEVGGPGVEWGRGVVSLPLWDRLCENLNRTMYASILRVPAGILSCLREVRVSTIKRCCDARTDCMASEAAILFVASSDTF